jgi:hypothetical protein
VFVFNNDHSQEKYKNSEKKQNYVWIDGKNATQREANDRLI